ncbi:ArnT family glycosyltransferase [Actinokineospora pegani]|uniref:ArnT family glycosyltransferase n=1 Tax=Actinokineospora pegani TaxID=2654637 RepID=UPI0012EAF453|nr:glycosyltransferase family 39 protein [Actinokineospora pegani]
MSTTDQRRSSGALAAPAVAGVAAVPWRGVLAIAGAVVALLLLVSPRYGHDGDEMYFVIAGGHPSWGYVDQSAVIPLLAKGVDLLFPGEVAAQRVLPALITGLTVVLGALIARELGGRPRAQLLTAVATAGGPFLLWTGHLLATTTFDITLWVAISYLVLKWTRTRQDRLLLAAGLCTALALQIKYLVPLLWVGIAIGALVAGPRDLFGRPALWLGALITVATAVPGLLWQADHGWPYLAMSDAVGQEQDAFQGGRLGFVGWFALYLGPVGLVLGALGLPALLRDRRTRFLGIALPLLFALLVLSNGRPYYLVGLFPLLYAAGAVALQNRAPGWWRGRWPFVATAALGVVAAVALLPVLPQSVAERHPAAVPNPLLRAQVGWPALADDVAQVYRGLPADRRADTVVLADVYPHAAALDFERERAGLPAVYSGHRGYWFFGAPPDTATTAVVVGGSPDFLRERFASVTAVGKADDGSALDNVVLRSPTIYLVADPVRPWSAMWPEWMHMTIDDTQ